MQYDHRRIDWRNQIISFLAVLLGVLFATWFADWNEQRKEEQKVQQALQNLKAEINQNLEKIDSSMVPNREQLAFMQAYLPLVNDTMEAIVSQDSIKRAIQSFPKYLHPHEGLSMNFKLYQLSDISFQTMTRTGLFGSLEYDLAHQLQQTYQMQDQLLKLDQDLLEQMRDLGPHKDKIRPILHTVQMANMFGQTLKEHGYVLCIKAIDEFTPGGQ